MEVKQKFNPLFKIFYLNKQLKVEEKLLDYNVLCGKIISGIVIYNVFSIILIVKNVSFR